MFDFWKTKEAPILYKDVVLMIIIDRPKPGKNYQIDFSQSDKHQTTYRFRPLDWTTPTDEPEKIFFHGIKFQNAIDAANKKLESLSSYEISRFQERKSKNKGNMGINKYKSTPSIRRKKQEIMPIGVTDSHRTSHRCCNICLNKIEKVVTNCPNGCSKDSRMLSLIGPN
jgi:hypothetical protein